MEKQALFYCEQFGLVAAARRRLTSWPCICWTAPLSPADPPHRGVVASLHTWPIPLSHHEAWGNSCNQTHDCTVNILAIRLSLNISPRRHTFTDFWATINSSLELVTPINDTVMGHYGLLPVYLKETYQVHTFVDSILNTVEVANGCENLLRLIRSNLTYFTFNSHIIKCIISSQGWATCDHVKYYSCKDRQCGVCIFSICMHCFPPTSMWGRDSKALLRRCFKQFENETLAFSLENPVV